MSDDSLSPRPQQRALLGIGLKVASVCVFIGMATLLKAAEGVPTGELVFFRSFFAIFPIVIFLAWRGELASGLKTSHPFGHLWRGVIGTTAMALGFYGLTLIPLPDNTTIGYATPLLIVVLSAVLLKEQVRLYRWSAVLVGLVGVLIIMWPQLTLLTNPTAATSAAAIGAIATFLGSAVAAGAMLMVRHLVQTERSTTIVIYFSLTSTLLGLMTLPFGWVMPTPEQWLMLISAGVAGGIAQILLTESYRHADMSVIAPFEYSSLILSLLLGYLVFGDVPTVQTILGGLIVVAAGIFIIYREHQLGLERRRAKAVSTPQG